MNQPCLGRHNPFVFGFSRIAWTMGLAAMTWTAIGLSPELKGNQDPADRERAEILEGLERGIKALRALGRQDESEHLLRILREFAEEGRGAPSRAGRAERNERDEMERQRIQRERAERERSEAESGQRERAARGERMQNERAGLMEQIEIWRLAHHAFREADRGDAAELTERILHARELQLQGERGEQVEQALRGAPGPEDQIELLTKAANIWKEFKQPEKGEALMAAARKMRSGNRGPNAPAPRQDRPAPDRPAPDRPGPDRPAPDRLAPPGGDRPRMDRIAELEQQVRRLEEQIRQIQQQLRDRR